MGNLSHHLHQEKTIGLFLTVLEGREVKLAFFLKQNDLFVYSYPID